MRPRRSTQVARTESASAYEHQQRTQVVHSYTEGIRIAWSLTWELPGLGLVTAPSAVLIRPDGYVAWIEDQAQLNLAQALTTWFGRAAVP